MLGLLSTGLLATAAPPASWQGVGIGSPPANPGDLNLLPGQLVGTCFSRASNSNPNPDPEGFVLVAFDTRDPEAEGAQPGQLWRTDSNDPVNGPFYRYHGDKMRSRILGEVFGVCVSRERDQDIWVAGTSCYQRDAQVWDDDVAPNNTLSGSNRHGRVYRIDGTTGEPVDVVALNPAPVSVAARPAELGNIAWSRSGNGREWVYVSNLNDGLIYRLPAQNLQGSSITYDHGTSGRPQEGLPPLPDNPSTEATASGRLVGGVQVHPIEDRLYYAVWNQGVTADEIWSVGLDATTGQFLPATAQREITLINQGSFQGLVSSLSFSANGSRLYAAEREHRGIGVSGTHRSRILEWHYDEGTNAWVIDPLITSQPTWKYHLGSFSTHQNSAGGVQPDCEGNVWVTGDFFNGTVVNGFVYGTQRIPEGGNHATPQEQAGSTSLWIDYNDDTSRTAKYAIGALSMWEPCSCLDFNIAHIDCPEGDEPFTIEMTVKNLTDQVATYAWLTPCLDDELPSDAVTTTPQPSSLFELDEPTGPGETTGITFTVDDFNGGETICLRLTLLTETLEECCTEKFCFRLPSCDCATIVDQEVQAENLPNGDRKFVIRFTAQNNSGYPIAYATAAPIDGFVEAGVIPTPNPIPPGQTGEIEFCWICPLADRPCPDELCFTLGLHDQSLEDCCALDVCVDLPPGDKDVRPDTCRINRPIVQACPIPGTRLIGADVRVTICNNFCEPRTYRYETVALPGNVSLSFPNGSGAVGPIPPGQCRTIPLRIIGLFAPGSRGNYQITFTPNGSGESVSCRGQIYRPLRPIKIEIANPLDDPLVFDPQRPQILPVLRYVIKNESAEDLALPLSVASEFGAFLVSFGDEKPEAFAADTEIKLEAGKERELQVNLSYPENRPDLPDFVRIDLFNPEDVSESSIAQAVQILRPDIVIDLLPTAQCIECDLIDDPTGTEPNGLFHMIVEVNGGSTTLKFQESDALPSWELVKFRLEPGGEPRESLEVRPGRYEIYLTRPAIERCFFRILAD